MKLMVPDYYAEFRCIADNCRHSCCIGWEIDIDADTLEQYKQAEGALGERLRANIDFDCDCPHFITGEDDRCPFLNEQNLCDLITELGDEALCNICDLHPRFRNEFSDRTEMGLGLCCEEAARLILSHEAAVRLICIEDDGCDEETDESDLYLYGVRDNAIAIIQDRSFSFDERTEHLSVFFDFDLPECAPAKWAEVYLELERLDENWTPLLQSLRTDFPHDTMPQLDTQWEQLAVYFLFRHLPAALWDGDVESKLRFAVLSVWMLRWLCAANSDADLGELARMYAAEIEYSDENLEILFETLM